MDKTKNSNNNQTVDEDYKYMEELEEWFWYEWIENDRQKAYMIDKALIKMKNKYVRNNGCRCKCRSITGVFDYI